jgi:hypothetical protein
LLPHARKILYGAKPQEEFCMNCIFYSRKLYPIVFEDRGGMQALSVQPPLHP